MFNKNIDELMNERVDEVNRVQKYYVSEIESKLNKHAIRMLVNMGSEVTVINEEVLEKIKVHSGGETEHIPMKGVEIVGETGVRSKRVTKQVWLEVWLGSECMSACLVVKGLNVGVILGTDTLQKKGMVIDFEKHELRFKSGLRYVRVPLKRRRIMEVW